LAASPSAISPNAAALDGGALRLDDDGRNARTELLAAIRFLQARGVSGGAANASARIPGSADHLLITSRGMPLDITEDDFGVVTLDGQLVSGKLGSGIRSVTRMHTQIYRRPGVGSAIHTHSPFATAFAVAHKPIPIHYEPLLRRGQTVDVPVTRYGERDSGAMVDQIGALLSEHPQTRAVLLANHGLLAFHETPQKAAELVAVIDEAAAVILRAQALGGSQPIPA
jgi:L-ribulose-5-phosphate 4-epimerase